MTNVFGIQSPWGLETKKVEKCIEIGDKLASADIIHIATEVYNSDRQLSIMQSLSAMTAAANAVQNSSVSELCVVKVRLVLYDHFV